MISIIILLINFLLALYFSYKKDATLIGYLVFFQEIHLVPFRNLGLEVVGYIYYILIVFIFVSFKSNFKISKSWIIHIGKNPTFIALILITCMLIFHTLIIGLKTDGSTILVTRFITQVIPVIVLLVLTLNHNVDIKKIAFGFVFYSVALAIVLLVSTDVFTLSSISRHLIKAESDISPIAISRIGGILFLVSFFYIQSKNSKSLMNIIYIITLGVGVILMVTGMSRGPLFAMVITLVFCYLYASNNRAKSAIFLSVLLFMFTIIAIVIYNNFEIWSLNNFTNRIQALENYERMGRFQRYVFAHNYLLHEFTFFSSFFMYGFGPAGFDRIFDLGYPHNFIIELVFEYGFFGLLAVIIFSVSSFHNSILILKSKLPRECLAIPAVFIFLFLASMVSGDLIASRNLLFISIVQVFVIYTVKKQQYVVV